MIRSFALLGLPALLLAACGERSPEEERPSERPGFWFEARPEPELEARQRELAALGYSDGYVPAEGSTGVVLYDPERAEEGLNLYSSGHGPEAFLTDMRGNVLHRWSVPYEELPGAPPMEHESQIGWRRVRLCDDGSLLAMHGGLALAKIDRDSRVLWVHPGREHHDLEVLADGRVVTLTRRLRIVPELNPDLVSVEDFLTVLSPAGQVLDELSLVDALARTSWFAQAREIGRRPERAQRLTMDGREALDVLHPNSVQVLDGTHPNPAFAAGNVLVCLRELNAVASFDLRRRRAVWYRDGAWLAPHDARLLPDGHLTLFDNMGHQGWSQVLEVDALTGEERWAYRGDPPESFFSMFCGTARRLSGGNTLVTESCNGRALEVTPEGEVVWAFRSPHRAGKDGELVAVLFEVERVSAERVAGWLER